MDQGCNSVQRPWIKSPILIVGVVIVVHRHDKTYVLQLKQECKKKKKGNKFSSEPLQRERKKERKREGIVGERREKKERKQRAGRQKKDKKEKKTRSF